MDGLQSRTPLLHFASLHLQYEIFFAAEHSNVLRGEAKGAGVARFARVARVAGSGAADGVAREAATEAAEAAEAAAGSIAGDNAEEEDTMTVERRSRRNMVSKATTQWSALLSNFDTETFF